VKWLLINTQVDVSKPTSKAINSILHWVISFNADNSRLLNNMWFGMTELCRLVYVCGEDVNVQAQLQWIHTFTLGL
jgi:hypothetical protein